MIIIWFHDDKTDTNTSDWKTFLEFENSRPAYKSSSQLIDEPVDFEIRIKHHCSLKLTMNAVLVVAIMALLAERSAAGTQ